MAIRVTEADLLDALAAASKGTAPSDARTAQEMADAAGITAPRVRKALRQLQAQGRLATHHVRRLDLSGRPQTLPGYTILPVKKARRG